MPQLYVGDCLDVLPTLPAASIDAVIIDPPYGEAAGAYGKARRHTYRDPIRGWSDRLRARLAAAQYVMTPEAPVAVSIGAARLYDLAAVLRDAFPKRELITITIDSGPRAAARGVIHRAEYVLIAVAPGATIGAPGFTSGEVRTGWQGAILSGFTAENHPNQAYPVWVRDGRIIGVGRSVQQLVEDGDLPNTEAFDYVDVETPPEGAVSLYPVTRNGRRGVWRLSHGSAVTAIAEGWIRADKPHMPGQTQSHVVKFLGTATRKRIASGELHAHGLDDRGALIVDRARPVGAGVPTIWTGPRYVSEAGSARLRELVGEGRFAYPKPVGLIADIITAVTGGQRDARILDFFAGTGTLFDAVTELNAGDGGAREAVMIEVDPKTAAVAQERIAAVRRLATLPRPAVPPTSAARVPV